MSRVVIDRELLRLVHDALARLHELPYLAHHPLGARLRSDQPVGPPELRRRLLEAIGRLEPPPGTPATSPRWRRHRYVQLRYVEAATIEQVVAALRVGERQARREHHDALEAIAVILTGSDAAAGAPELRPPEPSGSDDLDAELARLSDELLPVDVDVGEALADAARLVERVAAAHGVVLALAPSASPCRALVARPALRQLLLNLLVELMERAPGRRVEVAVRHRAETVEVVCRAADGRPVAGAPAERPRLAVVRRLAEAQGGCIRLGVGPADVAVALPGEDATTVLVIDDNPDVARLFRRYLQGAGFHTVQARTGRNAFEVAGSLPIDVITLDLLLPAEDGWDLYHALRNDPATGHVPVVACSVLPQRELAMSLGVDDFLAKPVTRERLLAALAPFRRARAARPGMPAGS